MIFGSDSVVDSVALLVQSNGDVHNVTVRDDWCLQEWVSEDTDKKFESNFIFQNNYNCNSLLNVNNFD